MSSPATRKHHLSGRSAATAALLLLPLLTTPGDAGAHSSSTGIAGRGMKVQTPAARADKRKLIFKSDKQVSLTVFAHDPTTEATAVMFRWTGQNGSGAGRTPLIELDPSKWRAAGSSGFKYSGGRDAAGGVRGVQLKSSAGQGSLKILGKGADLPVDIPSAQDSVWVHFKIENEWYCAEFGGTIQRNESGRFQAKGAPAPGLTCPEQICGNGIVEVGETCDDGNLIDGDACSNDCTTCNNTDYASTYEAIQSIIFDGYGCNSLVCHSDSTQSGGLDLTAANSYNDLVSVASLVNPSIDRVKPGDHEASVLWDKVHAGTAGTPTVYGGSPMAPGNALTQAHTDAIELWIRGGAPQTEVVTGTAELLATCLPPGDPLTIPVPDPPAATEGFQLQMPPWDLVSESEDEICRATYFDVCDLIPSSAKVSCTIGLPNNPRGECFMYHRQDLIQDPQSHHMIISMYLGEADTTDPGWGTWTYQYQDRSNPEQGQSCDPTDIDPATGTNPHCTGTAESSVACIGYGPSDGGARNGYPFGGSQQASYDYEYADGVYDIAPCEGIVIWNSHAFNQTDTDSTMSSYLNNYYAEPADQQYPVRRIFNTAKIFTQFVPPFETRDYCWHHVVPAGSNVFHLTSHTHQYGVQFRIYEPPTPACTDAEACTAEQIDQNQLIYVNTDYNDPVVLSYDPPIHYGPDTTNDERRYRFCSKYDNGSTATSPPVKLNSDPVGCNCAASQRACVAGPKKGQLCNGDHSFCDSSPGAGDGDCDACPVRGGVTTCDEMFILIGGYYED